MKVVERDFTPKGKMKPLPKDQSQRLQGFLPFYSVDTLEEANAIIEEALRCGEFFKQWDGTIIETTLASEQSLDNLYLAGERLAEIHERIRNGRCS